MVEVNVHPRVGRRHPELSDNDVASAWRHALKMTRREGSERELWVAVGFDGRGRLIEMVGVEKDGRFLVFHAMTPPSSKTYRELGMGRR